MHDCVLNSILMHFAIHNHSLSSAYSGPSQSLIRPQLAKAVISPHALIINTQFWFIALTLYLELGTHFHLDFPKENVLETHPDGKDGSKSVYINYRRFSTWWKTIISSLHSGFICYSGV